MILVENCPLDTTILERMIRDPEDLKLVWPQARIPFDHDQWREVLDPTKGAIFFLVYEGESLVGHAALDRAEDPQTRMVRFLFILPEVRDRGMGQKVLELLEAYARDRLKAKRLVLRVRTFNERAIACYRKSGFAEFYREGTLVLMGKTL